MADRIPIFLTARRKENFKSAPFEAKVFMAFLIGLTIFLVYLFILSAITRAFPYAQIFTMNAAFYGALLSSSLRLVFKDQSLINQITIRIGIIALLLMALIAAYYWPLYLYNKRIPDIKKFNYYKTLYAIAMPSAWIVILSIRLIPMVFKYYKLKREKQLT